MMVNINVPIVFCMQLCIHKGLDWYDERNNFIPYLYAFISPNLAPVIFK